MVPVSGFISKYFAPLMWQRHLIWFFHLFSDICFSDYDIFEESKNLKNYAHLTELMPNAFVMIRQAECTYTNKVTATVDPFF